MAEPDRDGISARLRKLPMQLLLALLNVTAILVIVAALVVLVTIARIDHFAENVVATMTEAVLSKVDLPSKEVLADLRNLRTDIRTLGNALPDLRAGEHPILQSEIAQLQQKLTVLNSSVDRLGSARSILTDEAIGEFGQRLTDGMIRLAHCTSSARQAGARRSLRNELAEGPTTVGPSKAGGEN